jgi:hypothetical protein
MFFDDVYFEIIKFLEVNDIKSLRLVNSHNKEMIDNTIFFKCLHFNIEKVNRNHEDIINVFNIKSLTQLEKYPN